MFAENKQRKVLLLGPSGAGKSTVCNALMNNKVDKESLSGPAKVSSRARGCTVEITNYVCDNLSVITDTVGFDDNRFDPATIAEELRTMISSAGIGYARIILCIRKGRISEAARIYLRLLDTMFENPEEQMLLYVSHCDTGTTVDDFFEDNKDEENDVDVEMGNLIRKLKERQQFLSTNHPGIENIVAGTMAVHTDKNIDSAAYLNVRQNTFEKIKNMVETNTGIIGIRTVGLYEKIDSFLRWLYTIMKKSFSSTLRGGFTIATFASMSTTTTKLLYYYGECAICLNDNTKQGWGILYCTHKFHITCLEKLIESETNDEMDENASVDCPNCRTEFIKRQIEKLP